MGSRSILGIVPGRKLDAGELRAARVVAMLIGGEAVPRDIEGAPEGSYDFDVVVPDGRRFALEITTAEDGPALALAKAALVSPRPAPGLTHSWWLGLPAASLPSVDRIAKRAPPLLAVLEQHDVAQVDTHSPLVVQTQTQAVIDAARPLFALGVDRATALPKGEAAELVFSVHGGAAGDSAQVNALVEEHVGYNIDKLRAATGVAERHLFITIPLSQSGAELAMATLPPPRTLPTLPADLDMVWVANWHARRIWRTRPGHSWDVLRIPDEE